MPSKDTVRCDVCYEEFEIEEQWLLHSVVDDTGQVVNTCQACLVIANKKWVKAQKEGK